MSPNEILTKVDKHIFQLSSRATYTAVITVISVIPCPLVLGIEEAGWSEGSRGDLLIQHRTSETSDQQQNHLDALVHSLREHKHEETVCECPN